MKKYFLAALIGLAFCAVSSVRLFSAETNAANTAVTNTAVTTTAATNTASPDEPNPADRAAINDLNDLVTRINAKLSLDKTNETNLASNLTEFEALVEKHKDASPLVRAQILAMKVQLFMEFLGEPENALPVLRRIKAEFPMIQVNGNTDDVIAMIEGMLERKKITDALVPGAPFPDFSEMDVEGKPLSISQYKGKVVLVDFWATWCMPCIMVLPEIQKAYEKYHAKGFEVIGVSLDDEKGRLQQFMKQKKLPWPQFFDGKHWQNKLAVKYGVDATPTSYLLNRDGKIIAKLSPMDDLSAAVDKALKE